MTEIRKQLIQTIEMIPENLIPTMLEIATRFTIDMDDLATPDDIAAHEEGMKEYYAGELISHEDIDWS